MNEAEQVEQTLDDIQLLHQLDAGVRRPDGNSKTDVSMFAAHDYAIVQQRGDAGRRSSVCCPGTPPAPQSRARARPAKPAPGSGRPNPRPAPEPREPSRRTDASQAVFDDAGGARAGLAQLPPEQRAQIEQRIGISRTIPRCSREKLERLERLNSCRRRSRIRCGAPWRSLGTAAGSQNGDQSRAAAHLGMPDDDRLPT